MSALEDYERGVKEGRGQGRFSSYKPWLIVKKVKSCAVRSRTYIRRFGRLFHLMSDAEVQTLLQLDWDDNVVEVREQYPLHPELTNYIAQQLNVKPAGFTRGGIVMTTDFLVTYRTPSGGHRFKAYQVKDTAAAVREKRTQTKLVIEQRYWQTKNIEAVAVVSEDFNRIFTDNLRMLAPYRNTACEQEDLDFWSRVLLATAKRDPLLPVRKLLQMDLPASPGIALSDNALNALKMLVGHKHWIFPIQKKPFLSCTFSDFCSPC